MQDKGDEDSSGLLWGKCDASSVHQMSLDTGTWNCWSLYDPLQHLFDKYPSHTQLCNKVKKHISEFCNQLSGWYLVGNIRALLQTHCCSVVSALAVDSDKTLSDVQFTLHISLHCIRGNSKYECWWIV